MEQWQQQLQSYFDKWNEGFETFNAAPIKAFYHDQFVGFWGNSQLTMPEMYHRDYDLESTLRSMPGAKKTFTLLHSSQRAANEVSVVGIFTAIYKGKEYPSHSLYILRHTENGWKILREYIEIHR